MTLKFEISWLRFGILVGIVPMWTRWFLPLNLTIQGYLTSCEITLSVFWLLHLSIRVPLLTVNKKKALTYLPRYKGL